jgi:hypothetical protein
MVGQTDRPMCGLVTEKWIHGKKLADGMMDGHTSRWADTRMDLWMDARADGLMDEHTGRWTDGWTYGPMDSYKNGLIDGETGPWTLIRMD